MFQFRTFFYPGNFLAKDFYAILSLQHIQLHIQILITRTHPCITENQEFIIALSGSFDIIIDDGKARRKFSLNRSYYGLYVPQQLWRQIENFSTNSLALVLSSTIYDENDYIREYEKFLLMKESEKNDI